MIQFMLSYVSFCAMNNYQKDLEAKPSFERLKGEWIKVHKFGKKSEWNCSAYPMWIYKRFSLEGSKGLKELLLSVEKNLVTVGKYCRKKRQGFTYRSAKEWRKTIDNLGFYRAGYVELATDSELAAHLIRARCMKNVNIWLEKNR